MTLTTRQTAAILLACLLLVAGCSGKNKPAGTAPTPSAGTGSGGMPAPGPAPAAQPGAGENGPDLRSIPNAFQLPVEQLAEGLRRYVNQPDGQPGQRLDDLYSFWKLRPVKGAILRAEADLDGDGTPEIITALNGAGPELNGRGALFVLYRKADRWEVDRSEPLPGVWLHAVQDLTGDGRPEIAWSSTQVGAHTPHSGVSVSAWRPGQGLQQLPGGRFGIAAMEFALDGRDPVLSGGLIGSVGAGGLQRARTDRYRWVDGAFRQVDRRYTPSDLGYDRLIDGITAEEFGRTADARSAYREAMDAGRPAFRGAVLPPEFAQKAPDAVREFARTRLALLLLHEGQGAEAQRVLTEASGAYAGLPKALLGKADRTAACDAAQDYAAGSTDFLDALNSPLGYANPHWNLSDLCGSVPLVD